MIYSLKPEENKFIEKIYNQTRKEFLKFYGLDNEIINPAVILLKNKQEIENLYGRKIGWLLGWENRNLFLLNPKNYEKESNYKYSDERFKEFIKHELSHFFFEIVSKGTKKPMWLNEGVSIFLSGQYKHKKIPEKFEKFLDFYKFNHEECRSCYQESGFVIKLLVDKFGKKKLVNLIRGLENIQDEKKFAKLFKKIYGFNLNYKNMNELLKK
ncbi:Uncharacterised protein [uncultured archaeon]|nr:Uncharacterised protein [uncultured archaeon]